MMNQMNHLAHVALVIGVLALNVKAQEYFLDDFEDGDTQDGNPVTWIPGIVLLPGDFDTGSRSTNGGDWLWTPTDDNMGAYVAEHSYENVSLRTVTSASGPNGGALYFMARDGYWAGIRPDSGELLIWDASLSGQGFEQAFLSTVPTALDPVDDSIRLQFELLGNSLSLTAWQDGDTKPSTPQILLNTNSYGRGHVGLFHNHWGSFTTATFGFFEAIPLEPPDYDGSGELDVPDIDRLNLEIIRGLKGTAFDLNEDNEVTVADLAVWVTDIKQTWFGDANLDGEVNFDDFLTLSHNYGGPGSWSQGDFDANGRVQFDDFLALASNFGQFSVQGTAAVPEPSSIVLAVVLGLASLAIRRENS